MPEIALQIEIEAWTQIKNEEDWQKEIKKAAQLAFKEAGWHLPTEVSILLTNDAHSQELNLTYRFQDKPTNVLSFPTYEPEELQQFCQEHSPVILGDIVLAFETVVKECESQKKTFYQHVMHLIVHGLLHLLGYDHEQEDEADKMESLEINILHNLGINNPYL